MLGEISFARNAAGAGKSARTKAQLMDATISVIAGQSIDGATVHEITKIAGVANGTFYACLLYTSPSPRDVEESRMPSSA